MKKTMLVWAILFTTLTMFAQKRQKQVWLGGLQRTHLAQDANVHRVYFDKWGNLYPDAGIMIPYEAFFDPYGTTNTKKNSLETGNLEEFYKIREKWLQELTVHYELPQPYPADDRKTFYAVQKLVIKRQIDSLQKFLDKSSQKLLVVMIHGFNDPNPTGDYEQLRKKLKSLNYVDGETVYLEIYWDGLTANQGSPQFAGIWGRAQMNSAYVSLGVRDILRQLHHSTKIRIITHSLGGSVGTGALFNTDSKWKREKFTRSASKKGKEPWDYFKLVGEIPTPMQKDIRLGMFCPAIPGGSTFRDFKKRGDTTVTPESNTLKKVIVGYNKNDFAVTKRYKGYDFLSDKAGSTSLGCNLVTKGKTEITRSIEALEKLGFTGVIDSTNFTECEGKYREEHGLYYYLRNKKADEFLGKVFK